MSQSSEKKSFFTNLWDRRFFQFFATYIAASWGAIQALEWAVRRYDLPSAWVDKLVVFLVAMLPLVISVIYFHGRPGDDKWLKFEKVFYPVNTILALVLSLFLVSSVAEQTTEQISVTDEEGVVEIREVPKSQFAEKVVVFPIDEVAGAPTWYGFAVAEMIDRKLEQDMRVTSVSSFDAAGAYDDYGFEKLARIPFATKLNIAEDCFADFLIDCNYVDQDRKSVSVQVFDVRAGKEIASEAVTGSDIYDLTENMTTVVNRHIKLQEVEGSDLYLDLPAMDLMTADTVALRHYIQGRILFEVAPANTSAYVEEFQMSAESDESCVECWSSLARSLAVSGKDAMSAMKNAMKYIDNVSERQQLNVKHINYLSKNENVKARKLNEMWMKLYPQDIKPINNLMRMNNQMFMKEESRALAKEAIERGHGGSMYLTYARSLIDAKEYDEAQIYIEKYKSEYPKQFEATLLLVDVLQSKGNSAEAMEALEELILMKPNEIQYKLRKADILALQNDFSGALSLLNSNLEELEIADDSIKNYSAQLKVYARALQFEKYYRTRDKMKAVYMHNYPPIAFLQTEYATVGYYKDIGHMDSIRYNIESLTDVLAPAQQTMITNVNEFLFDLFGEDVENIDASYEKVRPMFESLGSKLIVLVYESEMSFIKGDYEEAIAAYAEYTAEIDDLSMISLNYPETYLRLERYDEGLEVVEGLLKEDPLNSQFNLYKAIFLDKLRNEKEAKSILRSVMPIFRASDQRYKMTKVANELAQKLGI